MKRLEILLLCLLVLATDFRMECYYLFNIFLLAADFYIRWTSANTLLLVKFNETRCDLFVFVNLASAPLMSQF